MVSHSIFAPDTFNRIITHFPIHGYCYESNTIATSGNISWKEIDYLYVHFWVRVYLFEKELIGCPILSVFVLKETYLCVRCWVWCSLLWVWYRSPWTGRRWCSGRTPCPWARCWWETGRIGYSPGNNPPSETGLKTHKYMVNWGSTKSILSTYDPFEI